MVRRPISFRTRVHKPKWRGPSKKPPPAVVTMQEMHANRTPSPPPPPPSPPHAAAAASHAQHASPHAPTPDDPVSPRGRDVTDEVSQSPPTPPAASPSPPSSPSSLSMPPSSPAQALSPPPAHQQPSLFALSPLLTPPPWPLLAAQPTLEAAPALPAATQYNTDLRDGKVRGHHSDDHDDDELRSVGDNLYGPLPSHLSFSQATQLLQSQQQQPPPSPPPPPPREDASQRPLDSDAQYSQQQ